MPAEVRPPDGSPDAGVGPRAAQQSGRVHARVGRVLLIGGLGVFAAAFVLLVATGNTRLEVSAEEHGAAPLWALTLPVAIGMVLVRLIPLRTPQDLASTVHAALRDRPLAEETCALLGCLTVFVGTFLVAGRPGGPEDPVALLYPLAKIVLFLLVPMAALRFLRPEVSRGSPRLGRIASRPGAAWRWGGIVAVATALYLGTFSPLAPPVPGIGDLPPLPVLLVAMVSTFLTASVLEEIFFRVWLQTRLEVLFGHWAGIVLGALAFGAMHVVTHQALGHPVLNVAQVVAVQGVAGLLYGYLWTRYRNVWLLIMLHTGVNSLGLLPALLQSVQ